MAAAAVPGASPALAQAMAEVAEEVDRRFTLALAGPGDPRDSLYAAMRHAATGGGKRLRPLLVHATARLFAVDPDSAARVGLAIEAIHVYSLIHDDLPAMDDDDLRRGKPTVHKAFDEATAILAGDCLHALGFEWLAHTDTHPDPFVRADLVLELARAAGPTGMAGGQMMDIAAESTRFDLATVGRLQAMKTGALIAACVEMGAILGRLAPEGRTGLRGYARDIGLAFQIADDLLDVEGDEELAGKRLRKDEGMGKETFVSLLGIEEARTRCAMLVDQAIAHLHAFGPEADLLRDIARFVLGRDR